jgi:hypothetical protein
MIDLHALLGGTPTRVGPGQPTKVLVPMAGNRKQLVRERMRFTGESYRVALEEIRQFGSLPPAAALPQEWLEFYFGDWLGGVLPDLISAPSDPDLLLDSAPGKRGVQDGAGAPVS